MIQGFRCKDTQKLFEGQRVQRFAGIQAQAERRLDRLDQATTLADLAGLPSNGWNACVETAKGNTAFVSMINGEFVLSGKTMDRRRSKSLITTNRRTGYG
jgi:plasmid maintenance system killer protein